MSSTRFSKSNLSDIDFSQVDTPEASDDEDLIVFTERKQKQVIVIIVFTEQTIHRKPFEWIPKNFFFLMQQSAL